MISNWAGLAKHLKSPKPTTGGEVSPKRSERETTPIVSELETYRDIVLMRPSLRSSPRDGKQDTHQRLQMMVHCPKAEFFVNCPVDFVVIFRLDDVGLAIAHNVPDTGFQARLLHDIFGTDGNDKTIPSAHDGAKEQRLTEQGSDKV